MYKNIEDANELINEILKDITNKLDALNYKIADLETKEEALKDLQICMEQKIK